MTPYSAADLLRSMNIAHGTPEAFQFNVDDDSPPRNHRWIRRWVQALRRSG